MRHIESKLQQICVKWFRLQYPKLSGVFFAVPNGGYRNKIEGGILKAEGVLAGVADLILLTPSSSYHGLCIEMKQGKGTQQKSQKLFQSNIEDNGYKYVICRNTEEFINEIRVYLSN